MAAATRTHVSQPTHVALCLTDDTVTTLIALEALAGCNGGCEGLARYITLHPATGDAECFICEDCAADLDWLILPV